MSDIDRRRFIRQAGVASAAAGAVWAAPTVLGTSTAFADTSPGTCPPSESLAFVPGAPNPGGSEWPTGDGNGVSANPGGNNGWVFTQAGLAGTDALGVFTSYHPGPVPQFVVERNPSTSNIGGAQVTYTHTLGPFWDQTTYTFASQIYSVRTNQYTQLLRVQILDAGGNPVQVLGQYRTDTTNVAGTWTPLTHASWGNYTWTFHPAVSATYQFQFQFIFSTGGAYVNGNNTQGGTGNGVGDDIAVSAPTVACH